MPKINYEDFMAALQQASPAIASVKEITAIACKYFFCRKLFPATIFADLYQKDPYGRVRIIDLYQYMMRKVWYHHSRMGLSLYDSIGQGYLRESVRLINALLLMLFNKNIDYFSFSLQGSRRLHLRIDSYHAPIGSITRNIL